MKFTKLFKVFKDNENLSNTNYINFEDFSNFITSKDISVRKFNIKRNLSDLKEFNGKLSVLVSSALKYSFRNSESLKSCKTICELVEKELLGGIETSTAVQSSFDLYGLIAKTKLFSIDFLLQNIEIDESKIETLIIEHKHHFTQEQWRKICLFEWHFSKSYEFELYEYDNLIELKFKKFQNVNNFKECSEQFLNISTKHAIKTETRITKSDADVVYFAKSKHNPALIESELLVIFRSYCEQEVNNVISFDTCKSRDLNVIQVVIVTNSEELVCDLNDLCKRAYYSLKRKHNLNVECIYFIHARKVQNYSECGNFSRFLLRDDIELNEVHGFFYTWNYRLIGDEEESFNETTEYVTACDWCFVENTNIPLTAGNVNILKEWYLEVPIESQLLFEKFINVRSLKKTKDKQVFLGHKIEKLYAIYDILLNNLNKNYNSIFQTAQTEELLIEYKSIQSVFNVTSNAGITTSLKSGENSLKKKSTDELCYYNTYLSQHSLNYTNLSGESCTSTSLRQCHLILMLDNLVRLRYVADPNPGEGRSKQLCTLPITLQGLPLDSELTSTWHNEDCDGSETCSCKQPLKLTKYDVERCLLQLAEDEKKAELNFKNLMTWGPKQLRNKLSDNVLEYVDEEGDEHTDKQSQEWQRQFGKSFNDETESCQDDIDTEEDEDLAKIFSSIENEEDTSISDQSECENETGHLVGPDFDLSDLEQSSENITIDAFDDNENTFKDTQEFLLSFGFKKFHVPPLLCRHPPPASGRDDDINKIKEILDDTLKKWDI